MKVSSAQRAKFSIYQARRIKAPRSEIVGARGTFKISTDLKGDIDRAIAALIAPEYQRDPCAWKKIADALLHAGFFENKIDLRKFFEIIPFLSKTEEGKFIRSRREDNSPILAVIGRLGNPDIVLEEADRSSKGILYLVTDREPLGDKEIDDLTPSKIRELLASQVRSLTPAQMSYIFSEHRLSGAFTADQVRAMSPEQFKKFFNLRERFLAYHQVTGLDKEKLAVLNKEDVALIVCSGIAYAFPGMSDHDKRRILNLLTGPQREMLEEIFSDEDFYEKYFSES